MLNRDRNPEEYQKNNIEEASKHKEEKKIEDNSIEQMKITDDMLPEERASEMLKQFNEYLQKEKENRDNNRR